MSAGFTNFYSLQSLLPLIAIGIFIIVIIVSLDCIWRVEKHLNSFLKVLISGFILETLRMIARISGFADLPSWNILVWVADVLSGLLFLAAMLMMYRMIRSLNHEKQTKK